jgi:hypothetical protein
VRPTDRLGAAFRIEVSPATRTRHLAQISETLRAAPAPRIAPALGFRRRLVATAAAMAAVFVPVGTAVAAEMALPGEWLYPVKQFTEDVRSLFDEDLSALHRIEELEAFLDGAADPAIVMEAERRAVVAVTELDDPAELADRLGRARVRVRRQVRQGEAPGPVDPPAGSVDPVVPGGTTEVEQPGSGPGAGSGEQSRERDRDGSGAGPGTVPPTTAGSDSDGGESPGSGNGSGADGSDGDAGNGPSGDGTGGWGAGADGTGGSGSGGNAPGGSDPTGDDPGGSGSGGEGTGGSGSGGDGTTGGQNGWSGGGSGGNGGTAARP